MDEDLVVAAAWMGSYRTVVTIWRMVAYPAGRSSSLLLHCRAKCVDSSDVPRMKREQERVDDDDDDVS